jgi:hypothetical protein
MRLISSKDFTLPIKLNVAVPTPDKWHFVKYVDNSIGNLEFASETVQTEILKYARQRYPHLATAEIWGVGRILYGQKDSVLLKLSVAGNLKIERWTAESHTLLAKMMKTPDRDFWEGYPSERTLDLHS